jgi:hypothetical protein
VNDEFSTNEAELDDESAAVAAADEVPARDDKADAVTAGSTPAEKSQDPWKTAFIVLVGIVLLSTVLIYSTSSRRTEPTTVLQTDANGQPVQPLNPATGIEEERLAAMPADAITSNANFANQAGQVPGGDGYDPWANGGRPPSGAPVGPPGGYVTVPNGGSQFMPPECILQPSGIYLCPVPTNANAAVKPTPTPKTPTANANVQATPLPSATAKPGATPPTTKPSPTPRTRSTPAPAKTPGLED